MFPVLTCPCPDAVDTVILSQGAALYQCSYATNRGADRLPAVGIETTGLGRRGSVMSVHHPETYLSEIFRRHC